jgi:hypothetical protein
MGFLDHSTNNIIIDAVLTDKGRELLALNNGSFRIQHYAFGDDEVDYTLIKKFGRTVGKEKIEKNTPVFEAQTSSILALKYALTTLADPNLIALPYLSLSTTIAQVTQTDNSTATIEQKAESSELSAIQQAQLAESYYEIHLDKRFLNLVNSTQTPKGIPNSNIVIYEMSSTSSGVSGNILSKLGLEFSRVAGGSTKTQFQTNGIVQTIVRVVGTSTGASISFEVSVKYS